MVDTNLVITNYVAGLIKEQEAAMSGVLDRQIAIAVTASDFEPFSDTIVERASRGCYDD